MEPDSTFLITTEHSSRPMFYLPCIATWFASMILGSSVGYTSPAIASMKSRNTGFPLTDDTQSLLGSLMPLGAVLGAVISAFTVEKFGRKGTLMLCSIPCVIGWIMIAYADNIYVLLIGRFLTGVAVGCFTLAGPLYIAETASPQTRGFFGSGILLASGIGVFANYFIGAYLPWNWLAISNILYPIIMLVLLVFSPESPLFLMKHKLHIEAKYSLNFLFGINSELSNPNLYINEEDKETEEDERVSISDFRKKEILLPFCVAYYACYKYCAEIDF
ncbi:solute carrier family 2: facilitated glucose transporter member 8-like protein [Leptotrombidium deliense]|uniref:Solute carrier family 2: facilitated glucose transporter member 8-like protein n=1 Tax=Leptotrombidium deliense TaxID=299467 RepID=A0A443S948_9ACAR|nr:solute carrier family 2: facilitated glucose transporter member 8-like protein [Leptotrombidium deliense]